MAVPGIEMPRDSPILELQSLVHGGAGGVGVVEQYGPLIVTVTGGAQPVAVGEMEGGV